MHRPATTLAAALLLAAAATACQSTSSSPGTAQTATAAAQASPKNAAQTSAPAQDQANSPAAALTAGQALDAIRKAVPTARLTGTVTAANDPNHLLGRPGQYTSKVTFSDSRISASDTQGLNRGDVELGGAVEVFASPEDAATRAKYIEAIVKSMPMFAEYDYPHGTVLVRVSKYLTPDQAAAYKKAAESLG